MNNKFIKGNDNKFIYKVNVWKKIKLFRKDSIEYKIYGYKMRKEEVDIEK
jgi:hypothetical protein